MYLSKPALSDLMKVTVKIICGDKESEGSGIILMVDGVLYVLTAAHVIMRKDSNVLFDNNEIRIFMIRNSEEFYFPVETILISNQDTDAAVMRVDNLNSLSTTGLDKIRILTKDVSGAAALCGFHKNRKSAHRYIIEKRSNDIWGMPFELNVQSADPADNLAGLSGGGVFYLGTDGLLYLAGYQRGVKTFSAENNEVECPSAINFCEVPEFKKIIDKRQYEYIADSGTASFTESKTKFKPLDKSSYGENHQGRFIKSEKLTDIIKHLKNDDELTILLTALSGMGKSRLIYESFKNSANLPNRYYTKYSGNIDAIKGEMEIILQKAGGESGIIIIDDCPTEFVESLISTRNNINSSFRLIMVNHDYFCERIPEQYNCTVIKLSPNDITEDVEKYISIELKEDESNKRDVDEIKKLASGFPQMAIELVNAYNKEHIADPNVVSHLMPKLLKLTKGKEDEEMAIWQTLSLCMPFPYKDATHEGFIYMINNDHITQLEVKDPIRRRSMAVKIINKYQPTLIDLIGHWLYVRPFPLAVWLTSKWFEDVCDSRIHFSELIEDIQKQSISVQNSISEGFCKHIQQMHGNKVAFKMVEKLVNSDNNPFFNEEVLLSGLGSKLFLAMSSVNPAALASCLKDIFSNKSIEWLTNEFKGDGRRNVVWALERLCFAKESYRDAITILARLAIAENESIANNATGQLKQLFHIYLAGTEVDLNERLWALEQFISNGGEFISIAVECFSAAFVNDNFARIGNAEKAGFENKKDYMPKNYEEIFNYWNKCKDLLLAWLDEQPEIAEPLSRIIEENTFQWVRSQFMDIMIPLLNKVAVIKDYHWDREYDALAKAIGSLGMDATSLGVDTTMKKLRNNSFITCINETRYQLHGKYRMKDEEIIEFSEKLFEPLAQLFINKSIFSKEDELKAIIKDNEYIPTVFIKKVVSKMDSHQLDELFSTSLTVIDEETNDFFSPFLANLCYETKETESYENFLEKLKKTGKEELYFSLMGRTENKDFSNFYKLYHEQQNGELNDDFLIRYLRFFRTNDSEQFQTLLNVLWQHFQERPNLLIQYVITEQYIMAINDLRAETDAIIKKALLEYRIDSHDRLWNDYTNILIEFLQKSIDREFAKSVNKKMISAYNSQMIHLSGSGIFAELLRDYHNDIWVDFSSALGSPEYFLFYFRVKDEIGSGFGFGQGPLFEIDEHLVKQLCIDYPQTAPYRIACMAPCFEPAKDDNQVNQFSQWFIWLLDNFGEEKEVREGLSANLGTYTWVGTTIPIYERNIRCFKKLLNHKLLEVRDWAQRNIDVNKKMLDSEQSNEDYTHILYNL